MTLEMKIQEYLVPPSKIKIGEALDIGKIIFYNCGCCSLGELRQYWHNAQTDTAQRPQTVELEVDQLLLDTYNTHNLSIDEASGYLPLGASIVYFGKLLSHHLNNWYVCHPQRSVGNIGTRGQNPSTDAAIVMREMVNQEYKSKVLYEYKPAGVSPNLEVIQILHLMELFLQCLYVMKYEGLSEIIGCLTDLHAWHYFSFKKSESNKMILERCSIMTMTMPPNDKEITEHYSLLLQYLSPETSLPSLH